LDYKGFDENRIESIDRIINYDFNCDFNCDFYDPIDRPIRHNLGFDDVSLYFSKEFLRFCTEDLINLYGLMRFPDVVSFENQSVMIG